MHASSAFARFAALAAATALTASALPVARAAETRGNDRAADVARSLGALSGDSAADRARAERTLSAIVTWDDFDALRRAALAGDAEVRQRLVEVLATDERRLELAARFAADDDARLAELGRDALGELV